MKPLADPVAERRAADRLHYSTGELLGADDFRDEQTYHRRQLARALLYLHGSGCIAGLRVVAEHRPGQNGAPDDVELVVRPGLALDRVGRLIEVPRDACLRLHRWFDFIAGRPPDSAAVDVSDLRGAWRVDGSALGGAVVADVFLAFHACDRGYTPAFASGPFDALDASQPSRVRDSYELSLVLRPETDAQLGAAFDYWSDLSAANLVEKMQRAYAALSLDHADREIPANPQGVDQTAVLLARLRIPAAPAPDAASAPLADWSAVLWPSPNPETNPNNTVRNFLLPPAAVRRLA